MLRVLTNHANHTATVNHLALVADLLNGRTNLHLKLLSLYPEPWALYPGPLFIAIDDAAAVQVIRAKLDGDSITREDANEVLAHSARNMRQYLVLVLELYFEQRIRQRLYDHRHYFDCIFLRQTVSFDRVHASRRRSAPSAFPLHLFRGLLIVSPGKPQLSISQTSESRRRKVHAPSASLTNFDRFGKPHLSPPPSLKIPLPIPRTTMYCSSHGPRN